VDIAYSVCVSFVLSGFFSELLLGLYSLARTPGTEVETLTEEAAEEAPEELRPLALICASFRPLFVGLGTVNTTIYMKEPYSIQIFTEIAKEIGAL
jgi:hypothetical protein